MTQFLEAFFASFLAFVPVGEPMDGKECRPPLYSCWDKGAMQPDPMGRSLESKGFGAIGMGGTRPDTGNGDDGNNGHGNDSDGHDDSNPGNS